MENKMKQVIALACMIPFFCQPGFAQEEAKGVRGDPAAIAEAIVAGCAEAMGGMDSIEKIKTLRIKSVYPDHGDHTIYFEIERPDRSMAWNGELVFDGERACALKGFDRNSEALLIDQAEWVDYPVEIAYFFPAFFEYPAEFIGMETVDRRDYYKLSVTLPLGAVMSYLIDPETFLPVKAMARFALEGREITAFHDLFDYREVEGLYLPYGFSYGSRYGQVKGWITEYELNVEFEDGYFELPPQFQE